MTKYLQRIGTQKQAFSYEITAHYLQLKLTIPVRINIVWKRRKKRIETRQNPALSPSVGSVEINESLAMINTLYSDKTGFQRKKALLTVQAIVEGKGMKKVGQVSVNISDYFAEPLIQKVFPLEKCPDKNARLCISVHATPIGAAEMADNQSEMSGYTGFSMGTEGDLNTEIFEQDLAGFEEEEEAKAQVTNATSSKPPKPMMRLPDVQKPVNPVRIQREEADYKVQIEYLQKELEETTKQKDSLRTGLAVQEEKFKKEREGLVSHMQRLDLDNSKLMENNEKTKAKLKRREDNIKKLKTNYESMLNDLSEVEAKANKQTEDLESSKKLVLSLQEKNKELEHKSNGLLKECTMKAEENSILKVQIGNLEDQSSSMKKNIEELKEELASSRETLTSRGYEADEVFNEYRKKTEVLSN